MGVDVRSSIDFYTKFYNSLGRAPNHCSSSIGKTRRVVIVHSRNGLRLIEIVTSSPTAENIILRNVGVGYKAASPAEESFVKSSEMLKNRENVKSRSDKGYHAVSPPYTGNYIPPKPDLMFIDKQGKSKFVDVISNIASSDVKTVVSKHKSVDVKNKGVYSTVKTKTVRKNNFSPPIIEDWNFDDKSEVEFEPKVEVEGMAKHKEIYVISSHTKKQATEVHSPSSEIPIEESIPTPSNDPLPSVKAAQAKEIANLKKRVKNLEKRIKSRPAGLRRLKKDIDQDADIALVDEAQGRMHDADMFGVDDLEGNKVFVDVRENIIKKEVSTADPVTTAGEVVTAANVKDSAAPTTATTTDVDDELTLTNTLIAIKAAKPKVISNAATTVTTAITTSRAKGKVKMIEPEKPLKKKDQIALDEEVARKLEAEMKTKMEEEERIAREKDEAAQAKEIANPKKRVKKLEKRRKSRPAGLRRLKKVGSSRQVESSEEKDSLGAQEDASKQGRSIKDIDQDAEIALVDKAQGRMHDADMFGVDDLEGNKVFVDVRENIIKKEVSTADPVTTAGEVVTTDNVKDSAAPTTATTTDVDDELTLTNTLIAIKAAKPKVISNAATTVTTAITTSRAKGKVKMIEPEKPLKKKDQIALDEEVARKLEAEMKTKMEEEERIAREKDEVSRDNVHKAHLEPFNICKID
uniref:Uncharacterized protein n=1 Tax=Tanacetum cinerariifolium TaxID=118510 RepID=A0A6L2MQV9_TANCI|nr:hypothetical protein [Tanacetum cinerariifolium]